MDIEVLTVDDRKTWETFLLAYAPHALFQSWLWGQVQERLGHKVWRIGLFESLRLVGIAQIVKVSAKRGTFLHIRHGPVFISYAAHQWKALLKYLQGLALKERVWFIRVSPLISNSPAHRQTFKSLNFHPAAIHAMDAEDCWVLDISKPEEELLAAMRKTTRYEIKRAQKLNVTVLSSADAADLPSFFRLYKETSDRHGFIPHEGIREEFEVFIGEQKALLFLGKHEGGLLAGSIILFYGNQAIYHHGASVISKIPASYLVQWEAIREAKKRGMKVYNFWGIAPENNPRHPWRGITLFKKGFGGREIGYIHAQDLAVSPLYAIPRMIETIRRVSRGY